MYLCRGRRSRSFEEDFPHHNWFIVVLVLPFVFNVGYVILTPSIYQFVTTPRSLPEELENGEDSAKFWPGLGGTDTDYAWAIIAYAVFEIALMPAAVVLLEKLAFTITILLVMCMYAVAGVVYALAVDVWMVILARGLTGGAALFCVAVVTTYIGEMGTVMDDIRKKRKKKPIKFVLYILMLVFMTIGTALVFGLNAVMAQFSHVNPYRWPGWFITALALVTATIVLLCFSEPRSWTCGKGCISCSCITGLRLSVQLKSEAKTRFMTFLILCGYLNGQLLIITSTLLSPILSDQFGLSVANISYFFTALSTSYIATCIIQLGAKALKVNNRVLLGASLIISLMGCGLLADWQTIRYSDACSSMPANLTDLDSGNINSSLLSCDTNLTPNSSLYQQLLESCEALSSSSHQCFWNPESRVTGEFCNTCLPTCLSQQASLNFYQFSVGALLVSVGSLLGYINIPAVASDVSSVESQGTIMCLTIGSSALSRAVSPLWFVESYELTGRHTYLPMAITAGCVVAMLLSLVALYRNLAPIPSQGEKQTVTSATSKIDVLEHDAPHETIMAMQLATVGGPYPYTADREKESEGQLVKLHSNSNCKDKIALHL